MYGALCALSLLATHLALGLCADGVADRGALRVIALPLASRVALGGERANGEKANQSQNELHRTRATAMRLLVVAVLLALASAVAAEKCHPMCRWQCDDPQCPAVCHPVCSRPQCEMRCEETTCAKCTVHCERPVCSIRCPKDYCEKDTCPPCETVCHPAQCHTTCGAPQPNCSPVCEELDCKNKCVKPTNCAKPKCELQCERPACEEPQCCPCSGQAVQVAISSASCSASPCFKEESLKPSFLEVFHTIMHKEQEQGQEQCCPCH